MNDKIPCTPFSTALSGSARETERRIRNIFEGPKKRPPLPLIALVSAVCLLCGNLVSCQVADPTGPDAPVQLNHSQPGDVSLGETEPGWAVYKHPEQPLDETNQALALALFRAAERENGYQFQAPTISLLGTMAKDNWLLGVVFAEDHWENTLILGVMDQETKEVPHAVFQCSYHTGVPNVVFFQGQDGSDNLLYTFNGQMNGQYYGEAGAIRFDGEHMTWTWPVEGDVRYGKEPPGAAPAAFSEYQAYWNGHLALMAPGGVDIYSVNPEFEWGQDEPWSMWQLETGEVFYSAPGSAAELPMPIYFQALNWLNEYTGDPGGWRITELERFEARSKDGADCFALQAHQDVSGEDLAADLFFSYVQEGQRRSYEGLDHADVYETYQNGAGQQKDSDWDWDDEKWEVWDEEWEKELEAKQAAEYQSVGVTIDGKDYYYQNQLVNIFLDQRPDKSVYTLNRNPAGTVNVKILRSEDGAITGAARLTDAEAAELKELFED